APPETTSVISKPNSIMADSRSTGSVSSWEPARVVRTGAYCQARNRLPEGIPSHLQSEGRDGLPVARLGAMISLTYEAILGVDAELGPPKVIYDRDQAVQRC